MPTNWGSRKFTTVVNLTDQAYLNAGSSATLNPTAITISTWLKTQSTSPNNFQECIIRRDGVGGNSLYLIAQPNASAHVNYAVFGNASISANGTASLTIGPYYHLALTYDSVGGLIGYFNGVSDATAAANGTIKSAATQNCCIGGDPDFTTSVSYSVGETAIWNLALSSLEISGLAKGLRPNTVRPGSLIGYWPMDGLVAPEPDLSGNKFNASIVTAASGTVTSDFGPPLAPFTRRRRERLMPFPPEIAWGSRSFNGSSDLITTSGTGVTNCPLTMCCWVQINTTTLTVNVLPFGIQDSSSLNNYFFLNYDHIGQRFGGTCRGLALFSTTLAPSANTWYHLLLTVSGSQPTGIGTAYINGGNSSGPTSANLGSATPCAVATMGNVVATGTSGFPGLIADCAMWNVVLTQSEITALANGARPINIRSASLKGWWPLDGLQSPEPDISSFKNDGTLTGTNPAFGPPYMPFTPRTSQFLAAVAAPTFNPAWARGKNTVIEGVAT
jgi:hypothetical protein